MSGGEIAGLVAAAAFVLLVGLLALPILRLTRALEETRRSIERLTDETIPTLRGTATTVETVNGQLARVDAITSHVEDMTHNVSALTGVFAATLGGPAIKVAAFSYGVRRAMVGRKRAERSRVVQRQRREVARLERGTMRGGAA